MSNDSLPLDQRDRLRRALQAIERLQTKVERLEGASRAPIAIIGMGCRFPGADSPEALWRRLSEGANLVREVPPDRWNIDDYYDPDPGAAGKMYTRVGGFIDRVDGFDAEFFGIAPREAVSMDPQQRLVLEVVWEALENAGLPPARLAGSATGVFLGVLSNDYYHLQMLAGNEAIDAYTGTGNTASVAAGRISYLLGLEGPNLALDTACSSSLVAVHLACQSLRAGESDLALAGGVNLILAPDRTIYFCKLRAMAPDGRCKTFDARADGYVRGEGCGMVVLKRLDDAVRDGDQVIAVIRGTAVNQDGRSSGLTAPNGPAQTAVIRRALAEAGLEPARIGYVEAHGTGTALGDPIEAGALAAALGPGRDAGSPLAIGSIKTNMGHLEGAAGVAALMKAALMLRHRQIPPSLHFETPNPLIDWEAMPLRVPTRLEPWPAPEGERRLAGVNSFGLSGTNAHVILEEAPAAQPIARGRGPALLALSARSSGAVRALAERYRARLVSQSERALDVCYTAGAHRTHHEHRLALAGPTSESLAAQLDAFLAGGEQLGVATGYAPRGHQPKVVFVFPGQGGQWVGMGRGLLAREPAFRAALEASEAALRPYLPRSVADLLADADGGWQEEMDVLQPVLFALQVGLAAVWRAWGIVPDAVVGHSLGEIAAAHVAGALSLGEAARVIGERSRLLRRVQGHGGMAVVELGADAAEAALGGEAGRVSLAAANGPRSSVLAGERGALGAVLQRLEGAGVFCRWVKVGVAAHSPQVDGLVGALAAALADLRPRAPGVGFYTTVTAGGEAGLLDGGYWVRNLRAPVRFWEALQRLVGDGHRVFVELSPNPTLQVSIEQGLRHLGQPGMALASLRRDQDDRMALLDTLASLYSAGYAVDWRGVYPEGGRAVRLPGYPWQRERFWLSEARTMVGRAANAGEGHPLLGRRLELSSHADVRLWEQGVDTGARPYIADHQVQGESVLPATAYLVLAAAAAREAFGDDNSVLERVNFRRVMIVPHAPALIVQVALNVTGPNTATFQIASRSEGSGAATWTIHADGHLRRASSETPVQADIPAVVRERCAESITSAELYAAMEAQGLHYGETFRGVEQIWRREGEALGAISMPAALAGQTHGDVIHPALLDACLQVMAAAIPRQGNGVEPEDTYLPAGAKRVWMPGGMGGRLWSHVRLSSDPAAGGRLAADVDVYTEAGQLAGSLHGVELQRVDSARRDHTSGEDLAAWLHELRWVPAPAHQPDETVGTTPGPSTWLILGRPDGLGGALAARLQRQGHRTVLITAGPAYQALAADHYVLNPARPEGFVQLLKEITSRSTPGFPFPPVGGIVYLWALETTPDDDQAVSAQTLALGCVGVTHLVQALARTGWRDAPRLWLVTRGVQAAAPDDRVQAIGQASLWGLGRTLAYEHPELNCTLVDLQADGGPAQVEALAREVRLADHENQVALRNGERWVARLTRWPAEAAARASETASAPALTAAGERPFRLETRRPGTLDGLRLRAAERRPPSPGEVEIAVAAAGLNFLDVLLALGAIPDEAAEADGAGPRLGGECAGEIVALGAGADDLVVGQAVVALAPWSFGRFVTTPRQLVVPLPAGLSYETAAGIPSAFLTADYALRHVAQLARGERVLIHAAAGGVGLAAVQIAQQMGAEVFATAGSPAKRALLQSLGVAHVADSRSLDFVDTFRAATGGEGVDVVLNSLAGPFIPASLDLLRPYGRFVEIGKRDYYADRPLPARPFLRNLSFALVDLRGLAHERPARLQALFLDLMARFERGELKPAPTTIVPIAEAAAAFRTMAQAQHIGKIVVSLEAAAQTPIEPAAGAPHPLVREDGTYLITGGLGGLGLKVAEWLAAKGGRHLVLLGRSAPGPAAAQMMEALRARGVRVLVLQADVSDEAQLARSLDRARREMPPLIGVIHAAAVLDDGLMLQLTPERLQRVMAPKVDGAWNLHRLTRTDPLDCFILFSSAAGLLGSPGQANYAAANAFLDALAHWRRAEGLPALSIDWGPWAEVGLAAAEANRGQRLASRGMSSLAPAQGLAVLGLLLASNTTQAGVMSFNVRQWREFYPKAARSPLFALVPDETRAPAGIGTMAVRTALLQAAPADRRPLLEAHLIDQVAQVLRIDRSKIDPQVPLSSLGFESLVALEYRNRLEASLGLTLPATLVWGHPTVAALAPHLAERMGLPFDDQPIKELPAAPSAEAHELPGPLDIDLPLRQALDELNELSEADALQALLGGDGQEGRLL